MIRILVPQRFIKSTRKNKSQRQHGPLSIREFQESEHRLIKLAQHQDFTLEINQLQDTTNLFKKARISNLHPFLDDKDYLRVGGRIHNALIPFE